MGVARTGLRVCACTLSVLECYNVYIYYKCSCVSTLYEWSCDLPTIVCTCADVYLDMRYREEWKDTRLPHA